MFGDQLPHGALRRLGTVRLRHIDREGVRSKLYRAVVSPDGRLLASASTEPPPPEDDFVLIGGWDPFEGQPRHLGTVQIWDAATGVRLLYIEQHDPEVHSMKFSADGRFLYEGRYGGAVRFWNMETMRASVELQELQARRVDYYHERSPRAKGLFCLTRDGQRVVAVKHYDIDLSDETDPEGFLRDAEYSPRVQVWDLNSKKLLQELTLGSQPVRSVQMAGDGRIVLVELAGDHSEDEGDDGEWDEEDEEGSGADDDEDSSLEEPHANLDEPQEGPAEPILLVWDLEKDEVIQRIPGGWDNAELSHDGFVVQFGEPGDRREFVLPTHSHDAAAVQSPPSAFTVAHIGKSLAVVDDVSKKAILERTGHTNWVTAIVPLRDKDHLVTSSMDGSVRLWNWRTGEMLKPLLEEDDEHIQALAISPDGQLLCAAGSSGWVYKVPTGNATETGEEDLSLEFRVSETTINALSFIDSDTLVIGGDECVLGIWDVVLEELQGTLDMPNRVDHLALASHQRLLAKSMDGVIAVFALCYDEDREALNGLTLLHTFRISNPSSWCLMAVSPDGSVVVFPDIHTTLQNVLNDGPLRALPFGRSILRRWNVETGEALSDFPLIADVPDESVSAFCVAFSPDGEHLAVGDREGRVFLLDARTGEQRHLWLGHGAMVCSVVFLDDRTLASGSADTTVLIWHF